MSEAEPHHPVATPQPDLQRASLATEDEKPVTFTLSKDALAGGLMTRTCPMCGLNPAGPHKKRVFQYIPPWVYIGLVANVIVFLVLYMVGRKMVNTQINLCDDCARAEKRARLVRGLSIGGAILVPVGVLFAGLAAGLETAGVVTAGVALVGGIVGSVVAHLRTRRDVILTKKIDKAEVTLVASRHFPEVVAREQPALMTAAPGPVGRTARLAP